LNDSQDDEEPEKFELPASQTSGSSFQLSNGTHFPWKKTRFHKWDIWPSENVI